MRGSTPKTPKKPKNQQEAAEKYPKISIYIYIYLYFYGLALVSSGRDLDASKRASADPNPRTRMLGVAPRVFFKVDVPKTPKQVFGDNVPANYLVATSQWRHGRSSQWQAVQWGLGHSNRGIDQAVASWIRQWGHGYASGVVESPVAERPGPRQWRCGPAVWRAWVVCIDECIDACLDACWCLLM